jgi:hypothetical protein
MEQVPCPLHVVAVHIASGAQPPMPFSWVPGLHPHTAPMEPTVQRMRSGATQGLGAQGVAVHPPRPSEK